jgi:hypothetical protein
MVVSEHRAQRDAQIRVVLARLVLALRARERRVAHRERARVSPPARMIRPVARECVSCLSGRRQTRGHPTTTSWFVSSCRRAGACLLPIPTAADELPPYDWNRWTAADELPPYDWNRWTAADELPPYDWNR